MKNLTVKLENLTLNLKPKIVMWKITNKKFQVYFKRTNNL